jgi:hypothetical protein
MTQLRRQRLCTRIHDLGPRVLCELLDEIERYGTAGLDQRLERYAELDPEVLARVGADRFPPSPIRLIRGRAR